MDELTRRAMLGEKRCKHCQSDEKIPREGGRHDFRIKGNGLFYYDVLFGWEGVTINFCPWCGRDLTREE